MQAYPAFLTDLGSLMDSISTRIATELGVRPQQVIATIALLDEGATVPFIARYRKEVTGSLDDTQLRNLEEPCVTCANWMTVAPQFWPQLKSKENSPQNCSTPFNKLTPKRA